MRRLLHLLLMFTVLWCGSHLFEPGEARAQDGVTIAALDEHLLPAADRGDTDENGGKPAHSGHHCPSAADLRVADRADPMRAIEAKPFPGRVAALDSLAQAPPLEPPAA